MFSSPIPLLSALRAKPPQPAELFNCLNANSEQKVLCRVECYPQQPPHPRAASPLHIAKSFTSEMKINPLLFVIDHVQSQMPWEITFI